MFLRIALIVGWLAASLPQITAANEPQPQSHSLDAALTAPTLWETAADEFVSEHQPLGFRWISTAHDVAQNVKEGSTLFGIPVCQTLVRMKEGKVDHYTALFYNRGDMGDIGRNDYEALLRRVVEAVTQATGAKAAERGRDQTSAVKAYGLTWETPGASYLLEYSFTKGNPALGEPYRGEFIRLEVGPKEAPKSLLAEAFAGKKEKYNGPEKVVRDAESGDVYIKDVPMVDQGQKGYCVVASVERVLRLYEVRVDSNELAQLADSSASEGTSVDAMTDSLKKLTARFKIKVRTQVDFDYNKFRLFMADYNRAAKRAKEPEISLNRRGISLSDLYAEMNRDVLREVKGKGKSQFTAFQRHVRAHIDRGVPMLWSVILGVIPEANRTSQSYGGHMRLIIGYNDKTEELIFSDSWGIRHEFSKMPMLDAWCITTNLASVEPL